ncbi:Sas10/Utp3/C1D family-domain-containing protein [Calycina marina]|uniref:Exosome complex protein n=1 Tax=Calycina marina TaxID=1763456 RepID=A0A9P7Z2V6_9HELO|nr:Sas10/Utp3/C1D family-domain-containing protein [Calycina marina]
MPSKYFKTYTPAYHTTLKMDTTRERLTGLLEDLDDEIDDLEEALGPLLTPTLVETASKYPVLDKAKLYVLVTYAIESMIFSYLRLHGVKAREHAVFTELTRVKQYFEKLKVTENPVGNRENLSLDKGSVARIIKASLAANNAGKERSNEKESERARAHMKFEELSEKMKQDEISKKRKAEDPGAEESDSESESDNSPEDAAHDFEEGVGKEHQNKRKPESKMQTKTTSAPESLQASVVFSASEATKPKDKKRRRARKIGKSHFQQR